MTALGTRKLKIEVDGETVTAEVSKAVVTSAESDSDFVSFEDAAAGGGRDYALNIIAVQDTATGSLWDKVWSAAGTDVPVTLIPYGNDVPSVTEKHYDMIATITEPDGDFLGGEANASKSARFTFEVSWALDAKPTPVTAP